ncbi:hypothetical protein [Alloscardovia omnicolens]|uniref:hypothetical protein n=1 Tax=Alloscardovia omnicolens TaxID=419015 RepID=UPI003A6CC850
MVPVWVWVILWIFFFANFAYGVYYVIRHGLRALNTMSGTAEDISTIMARMSEEEMEQALDDSTPFFTRPLTDATDRYAATREAVEKKHIARSIRHDRALERWKNYEQSDLEALGSTLDDAAQSSDERASYND